MRVGEPFSKLKALATAQSLRLRSPSFQAQGRDRGHPRGRYLPCWPHPDLLPFAKARVFSLQHPPSRGLAPGPMAVRGQAGPSSSPGPGPHIPHPCSASSHRADPIASVRPPSMSLAWDSLRGCGTEGPNAGGLANTRGAQGWDSRCCLLLAQLARQAGEALVSTRGGCSQRARGPCSPPPSRNPRPARPSLPRRSRLGSGSSA